MSYRELRNFTETMKALGYPRLISVENFRTPNFELVADALYWLVHRYDPSAEIDENISSEHHRVEFLKAVATVMMSKARVKLNIKQLYRADGYAVKELLKISSLLYDAIQLDDGGSSAADNSSGFADVSLSTKLDDLKEARSLAGEIVESGSRLFGFLGREGELRESREKALSFLESISNLDAGDPHALIERNIQAQVELLANNVQELERLRDEAEKESRNLKGKIERKQTELERAEKRLRSLRKVKPAYMDEYVSLEAELRAVYDVYLERFRNLHYLESELSRYHAAELDKKLEADRALKRMQKRLRDEEMRILRGDQPVDEAHIDDDAGGAGGRGGAFDSGASSGSDSDSDDDRGGRGKAGAGRNGGGKAGGRGGGGGGRPGAAGGNSRHGAGLGGRGGGSDSSDSDGSDDDDSDGSSSGDGDSDDSDGSGSDDDDDDDDDGGDGKSDGGSSDGSDGGGGRRPGKPGAAARGGGGGGGGKPPGGPAPGSKPGGGAGAGAGGRRAPPPAADSDASDSMASDDDTF